MELHDDLTARERDILALLTKGYENQRIADELFISLKNGQDPCVEYFVKIRSERPYSGSGLCLPASLGFSGRFLVKNML